MSEPNIEPVACGACLLCSFRTLGMLFNSDWEDRGGIKKKLQQNMPSAIVKKGKEDSRRQNCLGRK